jgi:hypothetical protein
LLPTEMPLLSGKQQAFCELRKVFAIWQPLAGAQITQYVHGKLLVQRTFAKFIHTMKNKIINNKTIKHNIKHRISVFFVYSFDRSKYTANPPSL